MKKLIKLFVLFIVLSCVRETSISLYNDPIVNEHFNKQEIQELDKLLKFFENEVNISKTGNDIDKAYEDFFENLEPKEIEQLISFEKQESLLVDLDSELLNQLWYYELEYVPYLKDTVKLTRYPFNGNYFEFLNEVSENDIGIEKYFDDYTTGGDISPTLLAYSMKYYKENEVSYDLTLERNRLIIAINYLIFNEQLRLDKIQKNKKSSVHNTGE